MPAKINTLYEVYNSKDGSRRAILVETIAGEVERVKSFGYPSVFETASILREYTGDEFILQFTTLPKFKKLFGKDCIQNDVEL